jgi:hypothetical protein
LLLGWASAALAQQAAPAPARSVELRGLTGPHCFVPGKWSSVANRAVNATDQPARLRANNYFEDAPYVQFARDLWLPPRSRRYAWCPVRVPEGLPRDTRVVPMRTVAEDRSGTPAQRLLAPDGGLWSSSSASIARGPAITGVITAGPAAPAADEVRQVIFAMRQPRNLRPYLYVFYGDSLPATSEGLDGLNQLVVCGDRPASDVAGRAAIRDWLRGGGKLWLMLDLVQPETVQLLLGDVFGYQVVDRVGLTQVDICRTDRDGNAVSSDAPREYDQPVELVRVLVSDVEIVHTVNGWPASFRIRVSRGQVLCTTLGARGWMRPRTDRDPRPIGGEEFEKYLATGPLEALGAEFLNEPEPPSLSRKAVVPALVEQVGYRILGRGPILGILGAFCLGLIGVGVWLARREKLERLGWLGPAGAALAAALIVASGMYTRQSVPPTVVLFQRVAADAGSEELDVRGLAAHYQPEPGAIVPAEVSGGLVWPEMAGLGGRICRLAWSDVDACCWEALTVPAGIRVAEFRQTVRNPAPLAARGTFGPTGFQGHLAGWLHGCSDAVLIGPSGANLAVRLGTDGTLLAGPGDELARGQFIASGLLTDEQRRRQTLCQHAFPADREPAPRPRLAFWSEPLPLGFPLPAVHRAGAALVTVPIQIQRLPPGVRGVIPAPFLSYQAVTGVAGQRSSAYSNATREWIPLRVPVATWLRFQLPAEVLPFAVERASLTVTIDAPLRPVEVLGMTANGSVLVRAWQGPRGRLRVDIGPPECLRVDAWGGILVGLRVGEDTPSRNHPGPVTEAGRLWSIEAVALEVAGTSAEQH